MAPCLVPDELLRRLLPRRRPHVLVRAQRRRHGVERLARPLDALVRRLHVRVSTLSEVVEVDGRRVARVRRRQPHRPRGVARVRLQRQPHPVLGVGRDLGRVASEVAAEVAGRAEDEEVGGVVGGGGAGLEDPREREAGGAVDAAEEERVGLPAVEARVRVGVAPGAVLGDGEVGGELDGRGDFVAVLEVGACVLGVRLAVCFLRVLKERGTSLTNAGQVLDDRNVE